MRIVSLLPSATDIIADLGLMDSLVGVSEDCNWPPEVASKPVVARSRVALSGLTSAQIDEIVMTSTSESHSLYAVDAQLMSELQPDLVITQDLCGTWLQLRSDRAHRLRNVPDIEGRPGSSDDRVVERARGRGFRVFAGSRKSSTR